MFLIYRILTNLILIFSPIIILLRLFNKKEDRFRFWEKFGFYSQKKISGKLVWFHGASVGEILSIVPLIEKLEKFNVSFIQIINEFGFGFFTNHYFCKNIKKKGRSKKV